MKEMSKVPAHWEEVAKAVTLRDEIAPHTLIIGNGDVADREEGLRRLTETGADGIMIGRGVFTNVFCFEHEPQEHGRQELFDLLHYHLDLWEKTWEGEANFHALKRFFKVYVKGFAGASELREQLMKTSNITEARTIIAKIAPKRHYLHY